MQPVNIRAYDAGDWSAICAIHDAARVQELELSGLMDAYLTLEQTADNEGLFDGQVVVAEMDGVVCGFAAFTDDELTWLYVDPRRHKQGIGRALLRHTFGATHSTLSTEVLVGNDPALALYLSEGFVVQERLNGKLAGNEGHAASGYVLQRTPVAMDWEFRPARPQDAKECIRVRGLTRENAVSEQRLHALGITADTWSGDIASGKLPGFVGCVGGQVVGYCFGVKATGEIAVLALLPDYERQGMGRELLGRVVSLLLAGGHKRLFLACTTDSSVRSYGFYRHLGWRSTGRMDGHGDEILELEFL